MLKERSLISETQVGKRLGLLKLCINNSMLSAQLNACFFKTSYPKICEGVLAVELKESGISTVVDVIS